METEKMTTETNTNIFAKFIKIPFRSGIMSLEVTTGHDSLGQAFSQTDAPDLLP
jgi:hypothetical protein